MEIEVELYDKLVNCKTDDIPLFSLAGMRVVGKVVEMYDGDTCKIVFPFGGVLYKWCCRLNGIDTPEMKPLATNTNREQEIAAAHRARNALLKMITNCAVDVSADQPLTKKECAARFARNTKLVSVHCGEFDKYGRLLVTLYDADENQADELAAAGVVTGISYNMEMILGGFARPYSGGTKEDFKE